MANKLNARKIEKARWEKSNESKDLKTKIRKEIDEAIVNNRVGKRKVTVYEPKAAISSNIKKLRVAAYCRVSTQEDARLNSFEMQKQHFKRLIRETPEYKMVKIYADEGISGTSLKNRDGFNEMMDDCRAGKIDLILTKSISRFGRNIIIAITLGV